MWPKTGSKKSPVAKIVRIGTPQIRGIKNRLTKEELNVSVLVEVDALISTKTLLITQLRIIPPTTPISNVLRFCDRDVDFLDIIINVSLDI